MTRKTLIPCAALICVTWISTAWGKFPAYERVIHSDLKYGTDWGWIPFATDKDLEDLKANGIGGEPIRFLDLEVVHFNPKAVSGDSVSIFSVVWVKNAGEFKVDSWNYVLYQDEDGIEAHTAEEVIDPGSGRLLEGPNFRLIDIEFTLHELKPIYSAIFVRNVGPEAFNWSWIPATTSWVFDDLLEEQSLVLTNANPIEFMTLGIVDVEVEWVEDEQGNLYVWQAGILVEDAETEMETFDYDKVQKYAANGEHLIDVQDLPHTPEFLGIRFVGDAPPVKGEFHLGIDEASMEVLGKGIVPRRIMDYEPTWHPSDDLHENIFQWIADALLPSLEQANSGLGRALTIWDPAAFD